MLKEEKINIYILNSYGLIENTPANRNFIDSYLSYKDSEFQLDFQRMALEHKKCFKVVNTTKYYAVEDESGIYLKIPRGLIDFLPDEYFNKIDESEHELVFPSDDASDDELQALKDYGYTLRDDQLFAVRNSFYYKRGINQLATGAGKSIIACNLIKLLINLNPNIKILLCVPYDQLITQFSEYFEKFQIDFIVGTDIDKGKTKPKGIDHVNVVISTPITVRNKKEYLSQYNIVFFDEVQHLQSDTWSYIAMSLVRTEMSIGFSAKAIELENISNTVVKNFSKEEGTIIGGTGRIISYLPASYYIEKGVLAVPVMFAIDNTLPESLSNVQDWQKISQLALKDYKKLTMISQIANLFNNIHRRILILTNTHEQSFAIAEKIIEMSDFPNMKVGISHGANRGYIYKWKQGKIQADLEKGSKVISMFKNREISILIGTSHLDEGADIPDLDVCILAGLGKKSRRIIQRVGRSLRITKTGKYAYLVDFCDNGCNVLHKHYIKRLQTYIEDIGIPTERRFAGYSVDQLKNKVYELEEIK